MTERFAMYGGQAAVHREYLDGRNDPEEAEVKTD